MSKASVSITTLKRALLLLVVLLLLFALLLARIFVLQVFDFSRYQQKVLDQLTTESPVLAARGEIRDRLGRVLASNQTAYRVSLFPNVVAKSENREAISALIVKGLSELIEGVSAENVEAHLSHTTALERTVARSVDKECASLVLLFVEENKLFEMIAVEAITERYYPYESLASHVLGFTGSDGQGLYGLELQYNTALSGVNGSYITARDSMGNEMPNAYEAYVEAIDGATLNTTLDVYVQSVLEEQLEKAMIESGAANRVCGIVMDTQTGAILGMATAPDFNLNEPFELNEECENKLALLGLVEGSDAYREKATQLLFETWSNKAVTEIYMPGSTFKTLTCSMVLEEDVVTDLEEPFYCSGALHVADRLIRCHKKGGHGSLSFREGLQNSCNPVMMTIAARLGRDSFYDYVRAFGLLEKTGIDLPGEGNSIFHTEKNFTELDLATASFGQNFKVSVLQMITAVSAVANGGNLLSPYLVESIVDSSGNTVYQHEKTVKRQVISEETSRTISEILAEGVAGTGGAKNAYVAGYRVAAKTGTSEKIGDDANARIGSCVAYAPADAPRVSVIIVVDEPTEGSKYGSVVAAPYVANVLEAILPYLGVEAVYTEEELNNLSVRVPNCVGMSAESAKSLFAQSGLSVNFVGEGGVVTSQTPSAGTQVRLSGGSVTLTFGEASAATVSVPQVVGLSASEANKTLTNAGLNVQITGSKNFRTGEKIVAEQYPLAGESVPLGSVVIIRFPYDEVSDE